MRTTDSRVASLLNDVDSVAELMQEISSDSIPSSEDNSLLQAHVAKRRAELQALPPDAIVRTLLGELPSGTGFKDQMLDLDGRYLEQLGFLREKDARQRQLLAELKSVLQVYLEFDIPDADEDTKELRARLNLVLGARSAGPQLQKSRSKFLSAFDDLSDKAEKAWTTAQLHLIKERCDMIIDLQEAIASFRRRMVPLLQQQLDAIQEQRFQVFDELQKAQDIGRLRARRPVAAGWQALSLARRLTGSLARTDSQTPASVADDDDASDPLHLETQLHDLGLLSMRIEADKSNIELPPPLSDLFDPTLDYSKRFGIELQKDVDQGQPYAH